MVDVPSVVMLSDTPAAWDAVPRQEDGWWPTGGAVDPANDNGLQNWQSQVLARRDRWLRNLVEGAGIGVAAVANVASFDAITLGGQYRGAAGTTGAPTAAHPYLVNHLAGQSASEAVQTAFHAAENRAFMRRRVAGAWQPWAQMWVGQDAGFVHADQGWQRLPSGLILQWGSGSGLNNTAVTFPLAFPTALHSLAMADLNFDGVGAQAHILGYRQQSLTGFSLTVYLHDGTAAALASGFNYIAIGR